MTKEASSPNYHSLSESSAMQCNWRMWWFAALAAIVWPAVSRPAAAAGDRPNILMILSDDHGYGDTGVQGCKDIPTPNIDSLAKQGIRCASGYVGGPYCSPTRAGLMTGATSSAMGTNSTPAHHGGEPADRAATHRANDRRPAQGGRLQDGARGQMAPGT